MPQHPSSSSKSYEMLCMIDQRMKQLNSCSIIVHPSLFFQFHQTHGENLRISFDKPDKIVNDKIVKITLPRVKSVPTNYNKISNIGYFKYPKEIAYKST